MDKRSVKHTIVTLVAFMASLLLPAVASAQEAALAPSAALACLTRIAGAPATPVYPPNLYARKEADVLRVELTFRNRNEGPKVTFDKLVHNQEFKDEVEKFVAAYRVPCMADGAAPVTLNQSLDFSPTGGHRIMPAPPVDQNDAVRQAHLRCINHMDRMVQPEYPKEARYGQEENFAVRMRFTDSMRAPELVFLTEPRYPYLRRSVERFVAGLRMPCLSTESDEVDKIFSFKLLGSARVLLNDMPLVGLLAGGKDYPLPAYFDFNTMGCPFDVRLTYRRPFLPNVVRELNSNNPARRPFLEWLGKVSLDVAETTNKKLLGESANVSVPCGFLDLPAKAAPTGS